jgi:hypothetical protein
MAYLDLAPAIAALGSRPEEFEFTRGSLHHLTSRHCFRFLSEDEVQIHALCDCALLRARPDQVRALQAAFRQWHAAYWRPMEINREFAAHFARPSLWRRLLLKLLKALLATPQRRPAHALPSPLPGMSAGD